MMVALEVSIPVPVRYRLKEFVRDGVLSKDEVKSFINAIIAFKRGEELGKTVDEWIRGHRQIYDLSELVDCGRADIRELTGKQCQVLEFTMRKAPFLAVVMPIADSDGAWLVVTVGKQRRVFREAVRNFARPWVKNAGVDAQGDKPRSSNPEIVELLDHEPKEPMNPSAPED